MYKLSHLTTLSPSVVVVVVAALLSFERNLQLSGVLQHTHNHTGAHGRQVPRGEERGTIFSQWSLAGGRKISGDSQGHRGGGRREDSDVGRLLG